MGRGILGRVAGEAVLAEVGVMRLLLPRAEVEGGQMREGSRLVLSSKLGEVGGVVEGVE